MGFSNAMAETYQHRWQAGVVTALPVGKVVCVGRNYADHAKELNNDVPESPLLFLKPVSAMVHFEDQIQIPSRFGPCHYETEMTLLIGETLTCCTRDQAREAIYGVGIGLDLTRRGLQNQLKEKGQPWERAKGFDGSCVLSPFVTYLPAIDLQKLPIRLWRNDQLVQDGNTADMLFPVLDLLCDISQTFSLLPGDVVMTGTPKGVGELAYNDRLVAELGSLVSATATVVN